MYCPENRSHAATARSFFRYLLGFLEFVDQKRYRYSIHASLGWKNKLKIGGSYLRAPACFSLD
ncbi:hypothetical protein CENSYa_1163 [Cenarchaeum symbiosum A]|uniref:Uncharacterized protein n=1 Tax=Cenarchaeum symbiosum (strain A) TaxID=414004 RepID=A0RWS3_CENSY|nr:hypothetical protein CENSYa_1163 [Cenarchaeum symbiosum A]